MSGPGLIAIPARMASTRLPGKPLADIAGRPLIVHVLERAVEAGVGPVLVACCEPEVAEAVRAAGGEAAMTDPDLPSGSDRIRAALDAFDPDRRFDRIVNLQGDLPTVPPGDIRAALALLDDPEVDIGTVAAEIRREEERTNPNVVKAVFGTGGRALYFTRATAPSGPGPLFHHIGLYAWRRAALERFTALPPSPLEQREKLEQLRALEAGMRIAVAVVDSVPLGVDTPADLARAREILAVKP
ncbi:MAG: 3-deoxy-manno-octulosonate cytidylyltransferase [Alphaproteobacteria bacterium]|nr:3-deoxy-manno-octulosonate cytidylyltransferase [Alphaproteobacteria bacterium]